MTALNLKHQIEVNGGITVANGTPARFTAGYQVATPASREVQSSNLNELLLLIDIMELENYGVWYNEGVWYMDTDSVHTDTLDEAQAIGKESNQLAVYEWSTGNSINL